MVNLRSVVGIRDKTPTGSAIKNPAGAGFFGSVPGYPNCSNCSIRAVI
jgi:hypothetical protein